jgi:hypothetical protein
MPPSTPPLDFDHKPGFEIPTKHKEAIRQLFFFGKVPKLQLQQRYKLGDMTINRILAYEKPERARKGRKGRPQKISDAQIDIVIKYLSESYANRCLNWEAIVVKLDLKITASCLQKRLHQRGYFRCVACQKPYLIAAQVLARFLWAIAHIFWTVKWLKVLWSDEVTFLVRGHTIKQRVTRLCRERSCLTCI